MSNQQITVTETRVEFDLLRQNFQNNEVFGTCCTPERILLKKQEPAFLKQVILFKNCSRIDLILHRMSGKYTEWHLAFKAVLENSLMEPNSQISEGTSNIGAGEHRCDEEHRKVYCLQRSGHLPKVFRCEPRFGVLTQYPFRL